MEFLYGRGNYTEGDRKIEGNVILGEHRLYLKGPDGDLTQTYIPLEKIEGIKKIALGLEVRVRPSVSYRYKAVLGLDKKSEAELIKDIVKRRGFKKMFLKKEWVEIER